MSRITLIASRDPFDAREASHYFDLAESLQKEGNAVTLFLVQNGVLPARKSVYSQRLSELAKAGVTILADEFSLKERGIKTDRLAAGVSASPLDIVIDHMAEGHKVHKVLWH